MENSQLNRIPVEIRLMIYQEVIAGSKTVFIPPRPDPGPQPTWSSGFALRGTCKDMYDEVMPVLLSGNITFHQTLLSDRATMKFASSFRRVSWFLQTFREHMRHIQGIRIKFKTVPGFETLFDRVSQFKGAKTVCRKALKKIKGKTTARITMVCEDEIYSRFMDLSMTTDRWLTIPHFSVNLRTLVFTDNESKIVAETLVPTTQLARDVESARRAFKEICAAEENE